MIVTTIKYRFAAISAKLRYWTNTNFVRAKFLAKFAEWLTKLFNVKPRHKADYYTFLGFMISRKLVHTVIICVGLVSLGYLWVTNPFDSVGEAEGKVKVYAYNSFPLKFKEGKVNIKAKSGYVAYTGQVKAGYCEGDGELYDEKGRLVYEGAFSKNKYNGFGRLYYPSSQLCYEGEFMDNLYQGTGKLYKENGILQYYGEFEGGYKDGFGELYNTTGEKIFEGEFSNDSLVYTQLLGKTPTEINTLYTGEQIIYSYENENAVMLNEIDALYACGKVEDSITNDAKSEILYVLQESLTIGKSQVGSISQLKELLGEAYYEGNAYVNMYDAVALQWYQQNKETMNADIGFEYVQIYNEYIEVDSYNQNALIYMYVFEIDGLNYSFFTEGISDSFYMYAISA